MIKTPFFVLSLENRKDRQETVNSALQDLGVSFQFIFSNKSENIKYNAMLKATQIEVAIWSSHIKALHAMLETESEWCLILEDDFILKSKGINFIKDQKAINSMLESLNGRYSIFQVGFIENSYSSKRSHVLGIIFRTLFHTNRFDLRSYLNNLRYLGVAKSMEINGRVKICGLKKNKVLYGLRLGTHAYFINREAALLLINIFENRESDKNFMTIDQYLLTQTKNFKKKPQISAARLSESLVEQSTSPSDNFDKTSVTVLES
jgi:GR25 family glycosyltransferase involved in LPS biosynthesis